VIEALTTTVNGVVYILIILFMTKLVLKPRDFYFNPMLRPVEIIVAPILKPMQRIFHPSRSGIDFTPLLSILILYFLKSIFVSILTEYNLILAMIYTLQDFLRFFLQLFIFSLFTKFIAPVTLSNPIISFVTGIVKPFEMAFGILFKNKILRLICALIGVLVFAGIIWHILAGLLSSYPFNSPYYSHAKSWISSYLIVVVHALGVYRIVIMILFLSAVLSWISLDIKNPIVHVTYAMAEPIVAPVRKIIPSLAGFDLSPWIAGLVIYLLANRLILFIMKFVPEFIVS